MWIITPFLIVFILSSCQHEDGTPPPPSSTLPEIISVSFPSVIPPDGRKQTGVIRFRASTADIVQLRLEAVEGSDFTVQEIELREYGRLDLLGQERIGNFEFQLASSTPQQLVKFQATITDKNKQQSNPKEFTFSVQGSCVSPDPPAPCEVVWITGWGRTGSSDGEFRSPRHLAVDKEGNIFVADTGNDRIQKFDSNGNHLLSSKGGSGSGAGLFNNPFGIAIDKDGNLLIADSLNHRILKLSATGSQLKFRDEQQPTKKEVVTVGVQGRGPGQFFSPFAIAADNQGYFFVADTKNDRVQKFDFQGYWQASWGEAGDLPGKFTEPRGIAVDNQGDVYVVDGENHRIQKFDNDGNLSFFWGSKGSLPGQFNQPWGIAIDPKGNVYVVDRGNTRIQKFDPFGKFLMEWGRAGNSPGEFSNEGGAIGIAIDSRGYIYVSDGGNNRIQKFWVNK